jgi:tetratricopeptide (TPR) repeat protein
MNEDKLKQAALLYKQGNKSQAAILLGEIVRQDPNNSNAWYGLALSLDELDKKIFCLKKVIALEPSHQKAIQLLGQIQEGQKPSPTIHQSKDENSHQYLTQNSKPNNFIKQSINESTGIEKKLIFALVGIMVLLVFCISIAGVTGITRQALANNAKATATAEHLACTERFKDETARLLSQFFRQESIADVTARINVPEQISRLEQIRTETWNMPEKSCQPRAHSLLMDYMDKSIAAYVRFAANDETWIGLYIDSIEALVNLDNEVIRVFDRGGLVSLFRSKGYFYWEGLDDPNWKNQVGG